MRVLDADGILAGLNPEQRAAVETTRGPEMMIGSVVVLYGARNGFVVGVTGAGLAK